MSHMFVFLFLFLFSYDVKLGFEIALYTFFC